MWEHEASWGAAGPDAGPIWLDEFRLVPLVETGLGEALDQPEFTWRTSPEAPWTGELDEFASDGVDQTVSALATAGGVESWLETTVEGPGGLSFRWLAAEGGGSLAIDGEKIAGHVGSREAREVHVLMSPGSHTLRWQPWRGIMLVDQVTWTPVDQGVCRALDYVPRAVC